MTDAGRWRGALSTVGWGAALGALCLGVGGRVAMRLFALATDRPPAMTWGGVVTVTIAGAVAGLILGALLALVARLLRGRWRGAPLRRGLLFGAVSFAAASPGIRPPRPLTFAVFAPWFLLYGVLMARATERRR